ncbi:MAG: hypothetical protein CR965_00815, partial [Paludibacter sp.]
MGLKDFFKKLIGDKATRDRKEISPIVDKIKEAYQKVESLSNDELRQATESLKARINEAIKP